jgi:LEA14-like dessication related protein
VELVHVILEAISKHTASMIDPTVNYLSFGKEKFVEKNKFIIDTIMIRNPEKWKVA